MSNHRLKAPPQAGLFSASVTAFIIESYKTLYPSADNATVVLLAQISQQLGSLAPNSTTGGATDSILSSFAQTNANPSTSALVCNILWFLSLGFSLICALSATLVEQWTRHYLQASHSKPAPQDRARLSAYLYQGVKKYKMAAIVETIPMLLHISLFLFFAGLIAFLDPVNKAIQYLIAGILILCCILYVFVTILPIFRLPSPYWTPLSRFSCIFLRKLRLLHRRDANGNEVGTMREAREIDAMDMTPERDQRDLKAMCWTLNALREDNEFEPFVEVIPSVVSGFDYSAKWLMDTLMNHDDHSIKLGYRIPQLLGSCTTGLLDPFVAQKRAVTCIKAIWSLTMLSMPKPALTKLSELRDSLRFREDIFVVFFNVQRAIPHPDVESHILSAAVVVARSLLDMQINRATVIETRLLKMLGTHDEYTPYPAGAGGMLSLPQFLNQAPPNRVSLDYFQPKIHEIEEQILNARRVTIPAVHVSIEAISSHQWRLLQVITNDGSDIPEPKAAEELLHSVKAMQMTMNQVGFNLALEYVGRMLESDTLPHESSNTLRRAFLRINFKLSGFTKDAQGRLVTIVEDAVFTKQSQERLVNYLEEAIEQTPSGSTRLPQNIISMLLTMTRTLEEPTLIIKAIEIIHSYCKVESDDKADAVRQALERALPHNSPDLSIQTPKLDLFSSHLYADAKVPRKMTKSRTSTMTTVV